MDKIVSIDLETTGLRPDIHDPWEVAIVPHDHSRPSLHYHLCARNLPEADPMSLRIGGFWERYSHPQEFYIAAHEVSVEYAHDMTGETLIDNGDEGQEMVPYQAGPAEAAARNIAEALDGATLLGAAVHFDASFLDPWLREHGAAPSWSHRFLELGSFCAGAWGATKPLSTKAISDRIPNDAVHTALGDAKWNLEVYRSIVGSQVF